MDISANYNPKEAEEKWYSYWMEHRFFHSEPDSTKEPYCIVIPPPNVTGVLHMGHMLNNTIQDVLIRRARLNGKNACWVPGTDHASIATEAKVVKKLSTQGIKKSDLTRDEFLKHAWEWTNEHGGIILKQLRKLGASCDWERTAFTMDELRSESVIKVFVDLYNKGLIYRGLRMVNWDPKAQTALSNEEVIYREEHSKLYHLKYYVDEPANSTDNEEEGNVIHRDAEGRRYAVVATTRPETIMGDTAMCINPKDPKNTWLKGKKVIVPLVNRVIPVIEDRYVDIEFGTGCLKVTPAHDTNDYMLGKKHNLETIDIFNADGTISEASPMYVGMDRMDVRKQIVVDLQEAALIEKIEDYENKVGYSERNSDTAVEPRLCMQWFLKMQHFADIALPPVMNDELKFYPAKYKTTYKNWLENIQDWCISRQLWWGHRIPAYFLPTADGQEEKFVVAKSAEEALELAKQIEGYENITIEELRQDEDALDTWFSSWLWPISLFDGINNPGNKEISYYYPTNDLVTGPDIIFFWVARMIMAGYEYQGNMPFKNVYFTGIVRDKLGRKMSKSLGNSPDPLDLIEKFGADGVRVGMLLCSPAGGDLLFDESLPEQGRNFSTKIWNAFKLVKSWNVADIEQPEHSAIAIEWFKQYLAKSAETLNTLFEQYRLSDALMTVYTLFRDEFSSWLLEIVKPAYGSPMDSKTYNGVIELFETLMQQLHPFMPFITEEVWQQLREREVGQSVMVSTFPAVQPYDEQYLAEFECAKNVIVGIRNIRKANNVAFKDALALQVKKNERYPAQFASVIAKMGNMESIEIVDEGTKGSWSFIADTVEYFIPSVGNIDTEAVKAKLEEDLKYAEGFLNSVMKKLSNERFVNSAPAQVVENERKKQADAEAKIAAIKAQLASL